MKKEFPFFRFPGGKWSNATLSIVKKYGYLPVHWLYESKFTNEPINGGIVLFHFNQKDINQVREYLTNTTKQMLPLSEILNPQTGYEPIGWKNFSSKIAPKKQKSLEKAD
ncbi:MAG: hypothetical protein LBD75_06455 [Candidatus Peribacteria bacterium]|jgi:peptidoglycan/xylan/chitin deacetylase (PgdA/CDA1 family)|nr:hypothetical protein [Candidatus Peribacteria bacterium]